MRRVLFALFTFVLSGLTATAWYAYDKGFTKKWRGYVAEEFRKQGVEVSLRRLKLDPFRGLVAQGVKVFDARDRRRLLAEIDELLLGIDYANAVKGKTLLHTLDLRDANLSLPLDPSKPGGPRLDISKLNARLFLPPQQIYLARAEAEIFGIRIYAAGRLINPQAFRPKQDPQRSFPTELVERVIEEFKRLKFEGPSPVLSIQFTGDLEEPDKVFVDVKLQGEKIRRRDYLVEHLDVAAGFRNGVVSLQQCDLHDAQGELHANASFEPQTRSATLRLRSTLDLTGLLRAIDFNEPLKDLVFYEAPELELDGKATFAKKPEFQLLGHLSLRKFGYRSLVFESLVADGSWDGTRWSVRDAKLVHRTGEVAANVMQVPGDFRAQVRGTINPKIITPILTGKVAEWFSQFEFKDAPQFEINLQGASPNLDECSADADLRVGRASYRGVGAENFVTKVHYAGRVLSLSPFRVQRAEGTGTGGLIFDFKRNEVRLEKIRANVFPAEIAPWITRNFIKDIQPYRFKQRPPTVLLDGLVHTKGGNTTRLQVDIDAPGGMDYTFLRKNLSFPQISGKLLFTDRKLQIESLRGTLFGGKVHGDVEVSLQKTRPGHTAAIHMENVDFASLTKLYFNYGDSKGRLNGSYRFSGRHDNPRAMEGRGELTVTDGDVFAIPFLGPLSGVLNSIVPGMGYNVARKGATTFTIRNGVISTDDLVIEGSGFSMYGYGKLFYLDDRMDFSMRINAQGLPGVLLFPVSKLFEYVADDKLSKPTWRPKALPRL